MSSPPPNPSSPALAEEDQDLDENAGQAPANARSAQEPVSYEEPAEPLAGVQPEDEIDSEEDADPKPSEVDAPMWKKQPRAEQWIVHGMKVLKSFEGKEYVGTVNGIDVHEEEGRRSRLMYLVQYEDGDSEQLYASELRPLRDAFNAQDVDDSGVPGGGISAALLALQTGWSTLPRAARMETASS